jgi:hypothetical protein
MRRICLALPCLALPKIKFKFKSEYKDILKSALRSLGLTRVPHSRAVFAYLRMPAVRTLVSDLIHGKRCKAQCITMQSRMEVKLKVS